MGLDKQKPILTKDNFIEDPFNASNMMLSKQNRTSLPTREEDIFIDRRQSVYYSVEHALKRLLQNDVFIREFLSKSHVQVANAVDNGLSGALLIGTAIGNKEDVQLSVANAYDKAYKDHLRAYHTQHDGSFLLSAVDAKYIEDDMSNFDINEAQQHFQHACLSDTVLPTADGALTSNRTVLVENDILVAYECNDSDNVIDASNYVAVSVSNKKTGNAFKQSIAEQVYIADGSPSLANCTYMYKEWLSGFKELYIYVPTTYTFYNENLDGEHVNENATWIQVKLNARHFKLNHIYQAHICGQSLPMQIHNTDESNPYFNDVILPSMLKTMCLEDEGNQNTNVVYDSYTSQYVLYFVCYGTDAQAIRIFGD